LRLMVHGSNRQNIFAEDKIINGKYHKIKDGALHPLNCALDRQVVWHYGAERVRKTQKNRPLVSAYSILPRHSRGA
jgi:hypothetical protein